MPASIRLDRLACNGHRTLASSASRHAERRLQFLWAVVLRKSPGNARAQGLQAGTLCIEATSVLVCTQNNEHVTGIYELCLVPTSRGIVCDDDGTPHVRRHPARPAAPYLCGQAARGRPHARGLQHPEGCVPLLSACLAFGASLSWMHALGATPQLPASGRLVPARQDVWSLTALEAGGRGCRVDAAPCAAPARRHHRALSAGACQALQL